MYKSRRYDNDKLILGICRAKKKSKSVPDLCDICQKPLEAGLVKQHASCARNTVTLTSPDGAEYTYYRNDDKSFHCRSCDFTHIGRPEFKVNVSNSIIKHILTVFRRTLRNSILTEILHAVRTIELLKIRLPQIRRTDNRAHRTSPSLTSAKSSSPNMVSSFTRIFSSAASASLLSTFVKCEATLLRSTRNSERGRPCKRTLTLLFSARIPYSLLNLGTPLTLFLASHTLRRDSP
jgi:hypothetical protein